MLAQRLRYTIRDKKRITIKEAARRAGLPRSSLEKLILGQRTDPHMSTLMAIAVGLDVSIDYLAGIKGGVDHDPDTSEATHAQGGASPGE